LGLPKLVQEKQLLLIASFTINRYKLIFDTGAWFLKELGAADFRNLEDFAKYLPEVSIAATCGGIPIKPQIERLAAPTHRGSTGSFN
jgi:hypothetical protein